MLAGALLVLREAAVQAAPRVVRLQRPLKHAVALLLLRRRRVGPAEVLCVPHARLSLRNGGGRCCHCCGAGDEDAPSRTVHPSLPAGAASRGDAAGHGLSWPNAGGGVPRSRACSPGALAHGRVARVDGRVERSVPSSIIVISASTLRSSACAAQSLSDAACERACAAAASGERDAAGAKAR